VVDAHRAGARLAVDGDGRVDVAGAFGIGMMGIDLGGPLYTSAGLDDVFMLQLRP
jgi:hypothetical protein